ncbi:hypothetical protein GXW74_17185 [Roseomonas eburnea]|uniref:Uncharacterized protein n=1 Tax=Neoroseomonas eburnea TaxID=1346889 RepID=A0A9X9XEU2_9PROT|nr:hypothetical protein [Neoroseomonas eburnea]MBR0682228.1 hypothetical protein [Neoroseomonas eburnea]
MTEAETTRSTAAEGAPTPATREHAADFAAASMRDLVACARIFYAAIHMDGGRFSDAEMDAFITFDDFLSYEITRRQPETAEDFVVKVRHLAGRIEDGTMSDAVDAAAIAAIKADAAAVAVTFSAAAGNVPA